MGVHRETPLLVNASALRQIDPEYPRNYAVTWMHLEPRRRWWALSSALTEPRLEHMYVRMRRELGSPEVAASQVAAVVIHAVVGRLMASLALQGRAWDPGLDNLWMHYDSDGGVDWAGVVDPTLRVLPTDCFAGSRVAVTMPSERALAVWAAHRVETTLRPLFCRISEFTGADSERMWSMVGESIVGTMSYVPTRTGCDDVNAARRGRLMLDAMTAAGLPVRSHVSAVRLRWSSMELSTPVRATA
ncbi:hypothetical protein IEU95_10575 [Hoyosella rhizosphaerae]|nr:hypothetical protein [Hoyosella rhizosphaerae]